MNDINVNVEHAAAEAAITLKENLGAALVDELKRHDKAWGAMSEAEQGAALDRLEHAVVDLIADAVEQIACRDFGRARVTLKSVAFEGDKVKISGTASKQSDRIHDLADLAGGSVFVVLVDSNEFIAGDFPKPRADQMDIEDATVVDPEPEPAPGEVVDRADKVEAGDVMLLGKAGVRATVIEVKADGSLTVEHEVEGKDKPHSVTVPRSRLRWPKVEAETVS